MGLKKALHGKRVYFDANIFIYLLEGNETFETVLSDLRDLIADEAITVVSSDLVYTEALAHRRLVGNAAAIEHIVGFIGNFEILPLSQGVAIHAGILRGETGMKTPDALHVACAIEGGCDVLLTNDAGMRVPPHMSRLLMSEFL